MSDELEGGGGGSRFPKWVIYVGILIGVNVLSYVFDWGFWIW